MALTHCRECKKDVSTEAKTCPHCGAGMPALKRKPISAGMGCLIVVGLLVLISVVMSDNDSAPARPAAPPPPSPTAIALAAVKLDFEWHIGGFGNVMLADFTVTNDGARGIKDFTIRCIHSAKSGTEIDRNTKVIYDVVPAKTTKKIRDVNMGLINSQAQSSRCSVINLVLQ